MTDMTRWKCPACGAHNDASQKDCAACGLIVPRAQRLPAPAEDVADRAVGAEGASPAGPEPSAVVARTPRSPRTRRAGQAEGGGRSRRAGRRGGSSSSGNWRILAIAGVAALVVGLGAWWLLTPDTLDDRVAAFQAVWADSGSDRFAPMQWGDGWDTFDRDMIRRGWIEEPPAIENTIYVRGSEGEEAGVVQVAFSVGDRAKTLLTVWRESGSRGWVPAGFRFPSIDREPGDAEVAALRRAWEAPGAEALLALLTDEYRARIGERFEKGLERREWLEARPGIAGLSGFSNGGRYGDFKHVVRTADANVTIGWEYWHPDWRISKFVISSR